MIWSMSRILQGFLNVGTNTQMRSIKKNVFSAKTHLLILPFAVYHIHNFECDEKRNANEMHKKGHIIKPNVSNGIDRVRSFCYVASWSNESRKCVGKR